VCDGQDELELNLKHLWCCVHVHTCCGLKLWCCVHVHTCCGLKLWCCVHVHTCCGLKLWCCVHVHTCCGLKLMANTCSDPDLLPKPASITQVQSVQHVGGAKGGTLRRCVSTTLEKKNTCHHENKVRIFRE
uniref:Uncharacterized protein n=1 Tax=Sphaeramia orbicularis TaxID=375764 RepID=A0A673BF18_9TELE